MIKSKLIGKIADPLVLTASKDCGCVHTFLKKELHSVYARLALGLSLFWEERLLFKCNVLAELPFHPNTAPRLSPPPPVTPPCPGLNLRLALKSSLARPPHSLEIHFPKCLSASPRLCVPTTVSPPEGSELSLRDGKGSPRASPAPFPASNPPRSPPPGCPYKMTPGACKLFLENLPRRLIGHSGESCAPNQAGSILRARATR